ALWSVAISAGLSLIMLGSSLSGLNRGDLNLGTWLESGSFTVAIGFSTQGLGARLSALFGILFVVAIRFAVNYLHRERGFHRFFFILTLYVAAMQWLVLSANAVGTFIGWEIAGLCSFLLIAYAYDRPAIVGNAVRVFVTNRIGDAAFVLGIGLCFAFTGFLDWSKVNALAGELSPGAAAGMALCFAVAAFVKSGQFPFSPWLLRAIEGPTPSSAIFYGSVMVHAGIFLVCQLEPLFERSALAMGTLVAVGLVTAVQSYLVGLTQTDVKSSLITATSIQLGLMFMECGLGFWELAGWHLCAHVVVRTYQFLSAPSLVHAIQINPTKPVHPWLAKNIRLFTLSLQRFWLDSVVDFLLVRPVGRLSHDLRYVDDRVVDRLLGSPAPALRAVSALAQYEEQKIGACLNNASDRFSAGSGLAGKLAEWTSALTHVVEKLFVAQGGGVERGGLGRNLARSVRRFDEYILKPRYLVLFVLISLLVAF
ncbi:MAG: proton-conducting transporter transmembrane domain-containing protein, partial [Gammaproteobacteria bacterium]